MSEAIRTRRIAAVLIIVLTPLTVFSTAGAVEDNTTGLCELALAVCWATSYSPNNPTPFLNCVWGYSFCKEYVEPHIQ